MATMTWYEDEINDLTGFANGDKFTSDEQVREYFTDDNMAEMMGDYDMEPPWTQHMLDEMADAVIAHRWHYAE